MQTEKLTHADLDQRALDALKEFPVEGALAVLKQFLESNLVNHQIIFRENKNQIWLLFIDRIFYFNYFHQAFTVKISVVNLDLVGSGTFLGSRTFLGSGRNEKADKSMGNDLDCSRVPVPLQMLKNTVKSGIVVMGWKFRHSFL